MMKTVREKHDLITQIKSWKREQKSIAFVPTMGNLHAGHLALVEQAQQLADKVVVSIFVNPTQFDRAEDLQAYPRTLQADQEKLLKIETDLLFLPSVDVMYPAMENACSVQVPEMMNILEGASRKGHFAGVATIVAKLFNLVQPDVAIFGQKDFQQLMLIRQMVNDLNFAVEVVASPTVRDVDGLAMSSRNGYLTDQERARAANLYQELKLLREKILHGDDDYKNLCAVAARNLTELGFVPDYIEVRRQLDIQPPKKEDGELVILAAAWLGKARLIDCISLSI